MACGAALIYCFVAAGSANAAITGQITRVVKEVVVRPGAGAAATTENVINSGAFVHTGADSRGELTFADRTVARLGAKTRLRVGERSLTLEEGALLFDAPRGTSTATVQTGTIVVEGGGATAVVERYGAAYAKILVLSGNPRVYLPAKIGESLLLNPGQMLIMKPDAKTLAEPVDYDIGQLYRTSVLIGREFGRLVSQPQIAAEIAKQRSNPNLLPTNLVIYGRGTLVTLTPNAQTKGGTPKSSPSASPANGKR